MERVAVTGAAGLIGHLLTADLERDYDVRAVDRVWRTGPLRRRQDTRHSRLAAQLFAGADTVVALAGDRSLASSWATVQRRSLPATMGALEGARRAGARRVILASSNRVTGSYEQDEPYASICAGRYEDLEPAAIPKITSAFPIRPDCPYAVGKAAAEAAARLYADQYGLSVICLRLGSVDADDRPQDPRAFATLLSHLDLRRLVRASITAPPELRFATLYGVSANTWRFWDIEEGRRLLGYEPADDAERWRSDPEPASPC